MTKLVLISAFALAMGCQTDRQEAEEQPKPVEGADEAAGEMPMEKEEPAKAEEEAAAPTGTIVEVAAANPDFSMLVDALTKAELVDTLQGEGPFTVFAPTNEAFEKIPKEQLDAIMADKDRLVSILTHHVVSGKVMAEDVAELEQATMLDGKKLPLDTTEGVKIGDATVTKTDIEATNGVIHVIDTVLVPEE